jgi:hypothetical protein
MEKSNPPESSNPISNLWRIGFLHSWSSYDAATIRASHNKRQPHIKKHQIGDYNLGMEESNPPESSNPISTLWRIGFLHSWSSRLEKKCFCKHFVKKFI